MTAPGPSCREPGRRRLHGDRRAAHPAHQLLHRPLLLRRLADRRARRASRRLAGGRDGRLRRARRARRVAGLARARDHARVVGGSRRASIAACRRHRRGLRRRAPRAPRRGRRSALLAAFRFAASRVRSSCGSTASSASATSPTVPHGDATSLDVYRRARTRTARACPDPLPDPRRRLDDRQEAPAGLPLMYHLAARGWVCVAANYRLSPRATFPDHLIDVKRALAWIKRHGAEYGADPDFVVVTGGSAGGHLAALVALTANDPEYQPGFEDVDTTVQALRPVLRRLRLPRPPRRPRQGVDGALPRAARDEVARRRRRARPGRRRRRSRASTPTPRPSS